MNNKKGDFLIRQAVPQEADQIHDLMQTVYNEFNDKNIYVCSSLKHVSNVLTESGFGVVACDNSQRIVGCFVCYYPGNSLINLGRDIDLPEQDLTSVVNAEAAVVLKEYRGNSLQSKMLQAAEKLIDTKRFKYLLATVSPDNPASFKTLEHNGFKHIVTKEKYGGFLRRIYCKRI